MTGFSPGWVLFAGAALLLVPMLRARYARAAIVLGAPLLTLAAVWLVGDGGALHWTFLGQTLDPVHPTATGRLFATVFALAALGGACFGLPSASTFEYVAAFLYAGGAIGAVLAGDWISLLVYLEIMALASTALIWTGGTERGWRASMRYLYIHLFSGVLFMFGVAALIAQTGSTAGSAEIAPLSLDNPAAWFILAAVLINAGAPPLWAWVADAYPEASPSATVYLSAFTTKTAVYVLLVAFPGVGLLVPVGLAMVAYGVFYALTADDMRRLLSHSIVGQVGFMVVCIGIGTPLALDAAAAHAFAHILYKALLLMAAGSIIFMTGRHLLTEVGGLGRTMRLTAIAGLFGGLAIAAAPLTAGFASKSLITAALSKADATLAWYAVTAASALTLLYVGLRFPWFAFFGAARGPDLDHGPDDPPFAMRAAMIAFIAGIAFLGIYPDALYALLPHGSSYHPYTASHVLTQVQTLVFSALAFFALLPLLRPRAGVVLDLDWLWRVPATWLARHGVDLLGRARMTLEALGRRQLGRTADLLYRHHGPHGALARTWPAGSMVFWVAVLLCALLIFFYV